LRRHVSDHVADAGTTSPAAQLAGLDGKEAKGGADEAGARAHT